MCTVCGCGAPDVEGHEHSHSHDHDHDHDHDHHHSHHHPHSHGGARLDYGGGLAGVHAPGLSQERIVRIERDILSKNDAYAAANRARLKSNGNFTLNFVSSPGSGKTTLLTRTITDLKAELSIVVIEGDQQTSNDAERIRAAGARAIQVNTGKGCHLDAHMVGHALEALAPKRGDVVFIENVGNLVCPAAFDLGEAHKAAILSVTEGEDKPLKYPDIFAASDLLLINKSDLAPHVDFDLEAAKANALRVNPRLTILTVSARSGEGLDAFYAWLKASAALACAV